MTKTKQMRVVLDDGAYMPERAYAADAGLDLRTPVACTVPVHGNVTIDTGVHVELPYRTAGMVKSKSGLNMRADLVTDGVVDCEYQGSIVVKLYNHGEKPHRFNAGDKVAQLVIVPVEYVECVECAAFDVTTQRGDSGFGSTGPH